MKKVKPWIDATFISLDEWVDIFQVPEKNRKTQIYPNCCFPSEKHSNEYLSGITTREKDEIINILRNFLISTGGIGDDANRVSDMMKKNFEVANNFEYTRRVLRGGPPWEGITWIIDLLNHNPRMAIEVIQSYLLAHIQLIPDWRIHGLSDAMKLIRKVYLDPIHPRDELLNLSPREFEILVAYLFRKQGFTVKLTRRSHDGGVDIIIHRTKASKKELSLVECKRYINKIGVKEVRALLGVVEREGATRGLIVATSGFTRGAWSEANQSNRIELIDYTKLCLLLNEHFGPNWLIDIDRHMTWARAEFIKKVVQP
jgi:restriction system protein